MDAAKKKLGRPTLYNEKRAAQICSRLSAGESLSAICRSIGISRETLHQWLNKHESFADNYVRARLEQADHYAEQILTLIDELEPQPGENRADSWQRMNKIKLQIDSRKWICARMAPRKWGDRQLFDLSAEVGVKLDAAKATLQGKLDRLKAGDELD